MTSFPSISVTAIGMIISATAALAQDRGDVPPFKAYGCTAAQVWQLDSRTEEFRRAWSTQNVAALKELHAPDTEWINAYGRQFQDSDSLIKFLDTRLFPNFEKSVSEEEAAALRKLSYRCVGKSVAVMHLYAEGRRGESRNSGESLRRTHTHLVLEKRKGAWLIVHTAVMDVRAQ